MNDSGPSAKLQVGIHESRQLDQAVAYRVHRTNRLLLTHLARLLSSAHEGITPEKWFILAQLSAQGPLRQTDLTERALEDAPNVSRLVESLVQTGLLQRQPDPSDRRSRILDLTPAGRAIAEDLQGRAIVEREQVFDGFTSDDLQTFTDLLDRLDVNVRSLLKRET